MSILSADFCNREADKVAKELLGKYLVRRVKNKETRYKIVETEAYLGAHDKACHAHKGRTKRTEVMFGEAGHWYVYLCYGMHEMLNLVTGPKDHPAAVLIRGVEGISGPGRVTKALGIGRELNSKPASEASELWIEDRGEKIQSKYIEVTSRIGIDYAEEWVNKPLRFILKQ